MNGDIFWTAVTVAGIAIIGLATFGIVLACLVYDYQRAKLGKPDPDLAPKIDEATVAEIAQLRARVATLERLVTDDDRRVAGEIEKLRREEVGPRAGA